MTTCLAAIARTDAIHPSTVRAGRLEWLAHQSTIRLLRTLTQSLARRSGVLCEPGNEASLGSLVVDTGPARSSLDLDLLKRIDDALHADAHTLERRAALEAAVVDQPVTVLGSLYENLQGFTPVNSDETDRVTLRLGRSTGKSTRRTRSGCFYTPLRLIEHLLDETLEPMLAGRRVHDARIMALRVCDPACGSGHFLLAAAHRLARHLEVPGALGGVIGECVYGVDVDPCAVELCRTTLWIGGGGGAALASALCHHIRCAHALIGAPTRIIVAAHKHADAAQEWWHTHNAPSRECAHRSFHWPLEFPEVFARANPGFDVVVGNPPFLNQLSSSTALSRSDARRLQARSNGLIRGYSDVAFAFLLLAAEITRSGGRLGLVQPQSLLASRDAASVRAALASQCILRSLWVSQEHVFNAGVYTCAPTFEMAEHASRADAVLKRFATAHCATLPDLPIDMRGLAREQTWSHLAADASGVPNVAIRAGAELAACAAATADFRDQYYGLDGFVVEDADLSPSQREDVQAFPPLITSGLIDLAYCGWGQRDTRLLKRRWRAPRLDRRRMERDGALGSWVDARLTPKILLATQTRIIEVIVDDAGSLLPCVPVITITPHAIENIWRLAAALASPVSSALALRRFGGTALSAGAIKLAARQALTLPLPADSVHWSIAGDRLQAASRETDAALRGHHLLEMADAALRAFVLNSKDADDLRQWWQRRLDTRAMSG